MDRATKRKRRQLAENNSFNLNDAKKILHEDSPFAIKESYNSIRTNLMFMQQGEKCPVFVVTSPTANNGKTINAINLATSFAQMGKKVLLIDSDMRNPTIHRMFQIKAKNGLSEILAGITDNIAVAKTEIENLSVLTAGKIPPNPAELLSSTRLDKLLEFVKEHYDCVFIDSPPVNIVTDSTMYAKKVTGYIMVIKTDTTNKNDVKTAMTTIQQIDGNVLGFVLNDVNSDKKKYYSYYRRYSYNYGYGYGQSYSYYKK